MFATPRPKKPLLPPPGKKRKLASATEEVSFDNDARHEFLTGFHKRKLQRKKYAEEEAAKQTRQERIEMRKQMREGRRRDMEEHVKNVNKLLRESGMLVDPNMENSSEDNDGDNDDEFTGFPDAPNLEIVDHEEEYIDEDRYIAVKVESVAVTRDGLEKPLTNEEHEEQERAKEARKREYEIEEEKKRKSQRLKKEKKERKTKRKFTYENKLDRRLAEAKRRIKKSK